MAGFLSKLLKRGGLDATSDDTTDAAIDIDSNLKQEPKVVQEVVDSIEQNASLEPAPTKVVLRTDGYVTIQSPGRVGLPVRTAQFEYEITEQDTIKLLACIAVPVDKILVPPTVKDKNVTVIGAECFTQVIAERITCPDCLEVIEDQAFERASIKNIGFKEGLKAIGAAAFYNVTSLEQLFIPNTVTRIGKRAFTGSSISKLNIPKGITEVPEECFKLSRIKEITIPGNVKTIGPNAFANCQELRQVTIEEGVVSIGPNAFSNCPRLSVVDIPKSVTSFGIDIFLESDNVTLRIDPESPTMQYVKDNSLIGKCVPKNL